jgi:hypothetical protein
MAWIENEGAYERAIERRIKQNRAKGGRVRWFAAHDDAQTIYDWLFGFGEFEPTMSYDPRCTTWEGDYGTEVDHCFEVDGRDYRCKCKRHFNPLARYASGKFFDALRTAVDEWGGLTDGQHAAAARILAESRDKLAGRDVARAAALEADLKTAHVGTVGERREFDLTVRKVLSFDGQYGTTFINLCRDDENNTVVYKGSNRWEEGAKIRVKATIKAHDLREGVPQTAISRPAIIS